MMNEEHRAMMNNLKMQYEDVKKQLFEQRFLISKLKEDNAHLRSLISSPPLSSSPSYPLLPLPKTSGFCSQASKDCEQLPTIQDIISPERFKGSSIRKIID